MQNKISKKKIKIFSNGNSEGAWYGSYGKEMQRKILASILVTDMTR